MGFLVNLIFAGLSGVVLGYLIYRFALTYQNRSIHNNIQEKIAEQNMIYLTDGKKVIIPKGKPIEDENLPEEKIGILARIKRGFNKLFRREKNSILKTQTSQDVRQMSLPKLPEKVIKKVAKKKIKKKSVKKKVKIKKVKKK